MRIKHNNTTHEQQMLAWLLLSQRSDFYATNRHVPDHAPPGENLLYIFLLLSAILLRYNMCAVIPCMPGPRNFPIAWLILSKCKKLHIYIYIYIIQLPVIVLQNTKANTVLPGTGLLITCVYKPYSVLTFAQSIPEPKLPSNNG